MLYRLNPARGSLFVCFRCREDTKSLNAALEKYKRAVESSVEGGMMELGLKGFSQTLIEIASRDSIKARFAQSKQGAAAETHARDSPAGAQHDRCVSRVGWRL